MSKFSTAFTIAAAIASMISVGSVTANAAGGAKEFFVQDYQFAKPMHGYSGHSGNYFCDYQRLPNRKCITTSNGAESCRIVGWTLREMCQ